MQTSTSEDVHSAFVGAAAGAEAVLDGLADVGAHPGVVVEVVEVDIVEDALVTMVVGKFLCAATSVDGDVGGFDELHAVRVAGLGRALGVDLLASDLVAFGYGHFEELPAVFGVLIETPEHVEMSFDHFLDAEDLPLAADGHGGYGVVRQEGHCGLGGHCPFLQFDVVVEEVVSGFVVVFNPSLHDEEA